MPKEDTSQAPNQQIKLVKEALEVPMTDELRAKLEVRLAELEEEAPPDARSAPPAPLEAVGLPEGEAGADPEENLPLEMRPPTPEKGTLTSRDLKIRMIRDRLKSWADPEMKDKLERILAELQGETPPRVTRPAPEKPPESPAARSREQTTPPKRTVKIWTPSGEIEVVRQESKYRPSAPETNKGAGTTDGVDGDKEVRLPEVIPEPPNPAASVEAALAPPPGSLPNGVREIARGNVVPDVQTARTVSDNDPRRTQLNTRKQLSALILCALWVIVSAFCSKDLFGFTAFAFPGIAFAGLAFAGFSGRFRKSRLILAAAVAGWFSMALFVGFNDCCITPVEERRHLRPLIPEERYSDLKTPSAVQFEIFQLSVPGILLGLVGLWWLKRKDVEKSQSLERDMKFPSKQCE